MHHRAAVSLEIYRMNWALCRVSKIRHLSKVLAPAPDDITCLLCWTNFAVTIALFENVAGGRAIFAGKNQNTVVTFIKAYPSI